MYIIVRFLKQVTASSLIFNSLGGKVFRYFTWQNIIHEITEYLTVCGFYSNAKPLVYYHHISYDISIVLNLVKAYWALYLNKFISPVLKWTFRPTIISEILQLSNSHVVLVIIFDNVVVFINQVLFLPLMVGTK